MAISAVKKSAEPLLLIIIIRSSIAAIEQAGIKIDHETVWTIALGIYSFYLAVIETIKNRKKDDIQKIKAV